VFKIADALKLISPNVLRFFFISTLYSSPLEYAPNLLFQANRGFERIVLTMKRLISFNETAENEPIDKSMKDKFDKYNLSFDNSLRDNFNTPEAISVIMMACKEANKAIDDNKVNFATANYMHSKISEWLSVLGFKDVENTRLSVINLDLKSEIETLLTTHKISFESSEEIDSLVNKLIACREEARKNKQYALGDMIRKELSDLDILLEDQASKTIYRIVSGGTNDC
jgi:cysteinyl-tRNA synthetase